MTGRLLFRDLLYWIVACYHVFASQEGKLTLKTETICVLLLDIMTMCSLSIRASVGCLKLLAAFSYIKPIKHMQCDAPSPFPTKGDESNYESVFVV